MPGFPNLYPIVGRDARKDYYCPEAWLARWLEAFAPRRLAESWDNVGLLWGDPHGEVERVMTCLTVTAANDVSWHSRIEHDAPPRRALGVRDPGGG